MGEVKGENWEAKKEENVISVLLNNVWKWKGTNNNWWGARALVSPPVLLWKVPTSCSTFSLFRYPTTIQLSMSFSEWHLSFVIMMQILTSDNLLLGFFCFGVDESRLISTFWCLKLKTVAWVLLTFRVSVHEWFVCGINLWMNIHLRKVS